MGPVAQRPANQTQPVVQRRGQFYISKQYKILNKQQLVI